MAGNFYILIVDCGHECVQAAVEREKTAPRENKKGVSAPVTFNSKFIILFSHSLMDCKNKYAAITL
jgi:hypothetical protein